MNRLLSISTLVLLFSLPLLSQTEQHQSKFSNCGIKGSAGLGSLSNEFDTFGGKLEGGGAFFSLGWGIGNQFTLWLSGMGITHRATEANGAESGFVNFEVSGQYTFIWQSALQPYFKVGVGPAFIGKEGTIYSGGGWSAALGTAYFFNAHVGIGAELQVRAQGFSRKTMRNDLADITTDIAPTLDGSAGGLFLTLTVQ